MINLALFKAKLLDAAFQGRLTLNLEFEPNISNFDYDKSEMPIDVLKNIPKNWGLIKLRDVAKIYTGDSTSDEVKDMYSLKTDDTLSYITTKDLNLDGEINYNSGVFIPASNINYKHAHNHDILLCVEGANAGNKIGILDRTVCFGNKLCCFDSFKINYKYLYYYLQSNLFKNVFKNKLTGIIGGVSITKIRNMFIPLPTIEEQKEIASKLDTIFNNISIISESKILLDQHSKQLKSKLIDMAVNGLIEKKGSSLNDDENSNEWDSLKLKNIAFINTGESTSDEVKEMYSLKRDDTLPYITTKDLSLDGEINYNSGVFIPASNINYKHAHNDDILLCIEGANAGNKIGILDRTVCFGNKLCCFDSIKINPKFLYYYLQSNHFKNVFKNKLTGIIGGVSISKIREMDILVPPISEQEYIVNLLDKVFALIDNNDFIKRK